MTNRLTCLLFVGFAAFAAAQSPTTTPPPPPTTPVDPDINFTPVIVYPAANNGKLINISTRGLAGAGDFALIVGFVVEDGDHYVLIRAVGPTLKKYGVESVLAAPKFKIVNSSGVVVATATSWLSQPSTTQSGFRLLAKAVGAFPLAEDSADAVAHLKLSPGAYTVVVNSSDESSGSVLAEVYSSPTYGFPGL